MSAMKNVPHPHMFPGAGENAAIAVADGDEARAEASGKAADSEPPLPASPWANPMLKRATTDALAKPEAKRTVPTIAERVIELLRRRGPMKTKDIVTALDLNVGGAGLVPYIEPAKKRGELLQIERGVWGLPIHAQDAAKAKPQTEKRVAPEPRPPKEEPVKEPAAAAPAAQEQPALAPEPATEVVAPVARAAEPPRPQRIPDFQLTVGTAMLVCWPDGAVTLQRGGLFVELTESEARLLRMYVALRE